MSERTRSDREYVRDTLERQMPRVLIGAVPELAMVSEGVVEAMVMQLLDGATSAQRETMYHMVVERMHKAATPPAPLREGDAPRRIVRNESTPKTKAIWENVDRVASRASSREGELDFLFGMNGELHRVLEQHHATKGRGDIRSDIEAVIRRALSRPGKEGSE